MQSFCTGLPLATPSRRIITLCLLLLALPMAAAAEAGTCVTGSCHAGLAGVKHPHQPVATGNCLACHQQRVPEHPARQGKSFALTAKVDALCVSCHGGVGKRRIVHSPVKEGDCLSCHQPHGADGRFLLAAEKRPGALCFGCHDVAPFKKKYQHGPVAEGSCLACHDPHDSNEKALLKGATRELCLGCHDDFAKGMKTAERIHPPVREQPCTACHDPHSSSFRSLLKNKMPDLCVECHKEIGEKIKNAKHVHKPLVEGLGCGNCHSTHFSKSKGLLSGDQKTICLSCHNTDSLGTPPLRNIMAEVSGDKTLHGPLAKRECDGCHDPHASDFPRLLTGSYPATFYAPYQEGEYDLCLKCHDKDLLRFPETTMYTQFRNGDRNLHYLHVVDRVKGRTCRACHETHGADGPAHIAREGERFGQWRVLTRFQKTATGGSCAPGCHKAYRYDREQPVRYEDGEKNAGK